MRKGAVVRTLIVAWAVLWGFFTARELFLKGAWREYRELAKLSLDGKRAYLLGAELYRFIGLIEKVVPPEATYGWRSLEEGTIERCRATYYLYPRLPAARPEYLFVLGGGTLSPEEGYRVVATSAGGSFIARRGGA